MNIFRRTRILKVDPNHPEEEAIRIAADIIKDGGLVAFPTETVYGLGADYSNKKAIERIYKVKRRSKNKSLTLHISDMDMFKKLVSEVPSLAQKLINQFWPGPLTIILMSKDGKKTGYRMPNHKVALNLINKCGKPMVAPSANISGEAPPSDAHEVLKTLGHRADMILDAGKTAIGRESTVVDATVFPCRVLREGAVSKSRLAEAWHSE